MYEQEATEREKNNSLHNEVMWLNLQKFGNAIFDDHLQQF
jgi:hypothetical protein